MRNRTERLTNIAKDGRKGPCHRTRGGSRGDNEIEFYFDHKIQNSAHSLKSWKAFVTGMARSSWKPGTHTGAPNNCIAVSYWVLVLNLPQRHFGPVADSAEHALSLAPGQSTTRAMTRTPPRRSMKKKAAQFDGRFHYSIRPFLL